MSNTAQSQKIETVLELSIGDNAFDFSINDAIAEAEAELVELNETIDSVSKLKPDCDKLDYILAASSGALCGLIDIFLVGKPGESVLGEMTDKWFANRTKDFASLCHPDHKSFDSLDSAVRFLEQKFKVPYDQTGLGDAGRQIFDLNPKNHHFKSLAHNPTLLGLFFSIIDQYCNTSHFVSNGQLISLQQADGGWKLQGGSHTGKVFCGICNWFGHLVSDVSGSQCSAGSGTRGMGLPSPLWAWINDIIVIKNKLGLTASETDNAFSNLALRIFKEGYDTRFQTAQAIPVIFNELLVRLLYSVRRLFKYFKETPKGKRSASLLWQKCEPFSNITVKRMLTVAHGTFLMSNAGNATARAFISSGVFFNPIELVTRINIVGIGRFTICLYGEAKRAIQYNKANKNAYFASVEKQITQEYLEDLKILAKTHDDETHILMSIDNFQKSGLYTESFNKSIELAIKQAEESAAQTNKKIEELGPFLNILYKCLASIQELFERMDGLPDEIKETTAKLKKIRVEWKQLAENIEAEYNKSKTSAVGVGAGVGVALLGPTIAMSIATTFGVASTGTAIAGLSGAAATKAALAWLGGGALAAGGSGIAAGSTFLALAGPIGWGLAVASIVFGSFFYFINKNNKERLDNIFIHIKNRDIKKNKLAIAEMNERISSIYKDINVLTCIRNRIESFGTNYCKMEKYQKIMLSNFINFMESSTMLLINPIKSLQPSISEKEFNKILYGFDTKTLSHKNLVIFLANLLYNISLDDSDKKLLTESLMNNSEFLSSFHMTKEEFTVEDFITFINNSLKLTNVKKFS